MDQGDKLNVTTLLALVMLQCADCGTIIPAAENKFKFEDPEKPGPVYVCNACGNKRVAMLQKEKKSD